MSIDEAEKYLNLTSKNYDLKMARKQYANLLYKYHPDNRNDIPKEKKELMVRNLTKAYQVIKENLKDKKPLDAIIDLQRKLEADYNKEQEIHNLNMNNIPLEIKQMIEEYHKKYVILYQTTRFKLYDQAYHNITDDIINEYKEKYDQYRRELTYFLFNYLESGVQKENGNRSSLHSTIFFEYCEKYNSGSPYILNSIYEIIQKFISFFSVYIEEQQRIKNSLKKEAIDKITRKVSEYQKNKHYLIIKDELDQILDFSLQRIELVFEISPIKKVKEGEVEHIVQTFISMAEEIVERYNQFLLRKDSIIDNLENYIDQKIEDSTIKTNLTLRLLPLYDELNMKHFYSEIDSISQTLTITDNKEENCPPKKLILKAVED